MSTKKNIKKKMPFLIDDGTVISDSFFCMEYLIKKHDLDLDQHLTSQQKATGRATTRMLEEGLFFHLVYFRWIDKVGWINFRRRLFSRLPFPLKILVPMIIQMRVRKYLNIQGVGRHTRNEIFLMGKLDILAASELLGNQKFVLGNTISSFDASFFGFINNILYCQSKNPLTDYGKTFPNLIRYCQHMQETFFKESS